MNASAQKRFLSAGRRQLALVGILAVVFAVVLFIQFGGDASPVCSGSADRVVSSPGKLASSAVAPARNRGASNKQPRRKASPGSVAGGSRPWPVVSLEEAVRYDPFATPPQFIAQIAAAEEQQRAQAQAQAHLAQAQTRADADARRKEALELLRAAGVSAVLSDGREHVALIGSRVVRVGDMLEGFRVVAIGPEGVLLGEPEGGFPSAEDAQPAGSAQSAAEPELVPSAGSADDRGGEHSGPESSQHQPGTGAAPVAEKGRSPDGDTAQQSPAGETQPIDHRSDPRGFGQLDL